MTLRTLDVAGFKCLENLCLGLEPLTLLTGFNAAGKSTALQALLLITQGLRQAPNTGLLSLNGPLVCLGTAGEVMARGDNSDGIQFGVEGDTGKFTWAFSPSREHGAHNLDLIEVGGKTAEEPLFINPIQENTKDDKRGLLLDAVRDIIFLSASRMGQAETFPSPQDPLSVRGDVGVCGEFAPWWYTHCADDEVDENRRHPADERTTLRGQLDAYLSDLFDGATANATALERTSLSRLDLRTDRTSDWCRPANVGYGLSYAFPLLVAILAARQDQVIIVDSPEAHLHPRAQSAIGRILARFAAAGLQILVETHSDHVLSGVRLGILEGLIDPAEVAVHFFGRLQEEKGICVTTPSIDRNGSLDSWPEGFFDQAEQDLGKLAGWD